MKKLLLPLLIILTLAAGSPSTASAQSIKLVAGNTLNGAINGVLLGGATMALKDNSEDFTPVRVGLGGGTLYGIGMGIYDVARIDAGQQFYISGTFNDGTNSSVLVLLDTLYGAAGGVIVSSSIALIAQKPVGRALQYGAGVGAWVGFGFGLIDTFKLADGPNYQQASLPSSGVDGMLTYSNESETLEVGMLSPQVLQQKKITQHNISVDHQLSLGVLQLQLNL